MSSCRHNRAPSTLLVARSWIGPERGPLQRLWAQPLSRLAQQVGTRCRTHTRETPCSVRPHEHRRGRRKPFRCPEATPDTEGTQGIAHKRRVRVPLTPGTDAPSQTLRRSQEATTLDSPRDTISSCNASTNCSVGIEPRSFWMPRARTETASPWASRGPTTSM